MAIDEKLTLIKQRFDFVDSIKSLFAEMNSYLIDGSMQVPEITINFGNAEGKYNYGGSAKVLDLSWYARYKPTVDKIIIAFTYIGFIFLLYKRLPDIISGAGAITEKGHDIVTGKRDKGGRD